jgi:muramoyltetrapeptide carboxypeptidase
MTRTLPPGGTIGIFSTGSPVDPERFQRGIAEIERRGFRWKCPIDPASAFSHRPLPLVSAPLADRLRSLEELIEDDEVDLVIAARGGYGTLETLPRLDLKRLRRSEKAVVGYSDVSALLLALSGQGGKGAIHGPTIAKEFADSADSEEANRSVNTLLDLVMNQEARLELRGEVLRGGSEEGPLKAANLVTLLTLLGTPWQPELSGTILCLEDVGEAPYRIRRALVQLKLAGVLSELRGIVFGRFSRCEPGHGPTIYNVLQDSLHDLFADTQYPIMVTTEFGHNGLNLPIPLGCGARLNEGVLRLLESPLAA